MISKAAGRYARAILEIAVESDSLEKEKQDMELLNQTIESSRELKLFLQSPLIKKAIKINALKEIFEGKVQQSTMDLLILLAEKSREKLLLDITHAFMSLYKKHLGIIDVEVKSAFELNQDQIDKLTAALATVTGKQVQMDLSVRKELMGGLTVRIEDTIIDGSVKYKLSQLKESFTAATFE
jgi:F-type H+-transporting ATPase subunit delta